MAKSTYFLFMDESTSPKIRYDGTVITSLTGIVLSPEQCIAVRDSFLATIRPLFINKNGIKINLRVPEIHGSKMLPNEDDVQRLRIFEAFARFPTQEQFPIYRAAYYVTPEFLKMFPPKHYNMAIDLCWSSILSNVLIDFENCFLVPVMDTQDHPEKIEVFSGLVQSLSALRTAGLEWPSISIKNSQNIIGEVFFADSRFSALTEVVDVISYLRCINDQKEENLSFSDFKQNIYACNTHMTEQIRCDYLVEMNKMVVDRKLNTIQYLKEPQLNN